MSSHNCRWPCKTPVPHPHWFPHPEWKWKPSALSQIFEITFLQTQYPWLAIILKAWICDLFRNFLLCLKEIHTADPGVIIFLIVSNLLATPGNFPVPDRQPSLPKERLQVAEDCLRQPTSTNKLRISWIFVCPPVEAANPIFKVSGAG